MFSMQELDIYQLGILRCEANEAYRYSLTLRSSIAKFEDYMISKQSASTGDRLMHKTLTAWLHNCLRHLCRLQTEYGIEPRVA